MSGWVWLVSSDNGLPHKVPDNEAAIALLVARGFMLTDIPGDMPQDEEFDTALAEWQAEQGAAVLEVPDEAESATNQEGNE